MSLLSPLFLLGALAVVVPVVLHLFARESAPTVVFSTTRFLRRTTTEHVRRRRPRDLLLLLLRAAAVALVALAFARPFLARGTQADGRPVTVVLLDRSASMSATSAWQGAVEAASAAVEAAPSGHDVAVATYQQHGRVVLEPSPNRETALEALRALRPGFGRGDVAEGIRSAAALARDRPGEIVVVTDLQDEGPARAAVPIPEDVAVRVAEVPMPVENLAVTGLDVVGGRAMATVTNTGTSARDATVRCFLDERAVGSAPARVDPGESVGVSVALPPGPSGALLARVDDAGGIEADNARWMLIEKPVRLPVLMVTSAEPVGDQALYLERALQTAGGDVAFDVEAVGADSARLEQAEALSQANAIILAGSRGLRRSAAGRLVDRVQGGAGLLVVLGPDTNPGFAQDLLGGRDRVRASQDVAVPAGLAMVIKRSRHETFAALRDREAALSLVRFSRTVPFAWQGADTLVEFTDGRAALVEGRLGRGRVLVFASDLGRLWNDWPVQTTFLPWIHETVRVLAGEPGWPRAVESGSLLVADESPAGIARLTGSPRRVAVNVPASESSLARQPAAALVAAVSRTPVDPDRRRAVVAAEDESRQSWWRYVLMAVLIVLLTETLVAPRGARAAASAGQLLGG